ncbi:MAG: restriction endonuclease subunit S [Pirellulales bacterium]
MSKAWAVVPLGEVLVRSTQTVEIDPAGRYQEITIRLWGKGIVSRGEIDGQQIASARRFLVRAGQFVLSRIDARNGALGIVPAELDGAVASNDFPAYNVKQTTLLAPFLGWLTKTRRFVESCQAASEGTTNRVRLQEERFLSVEIPLPPLAEQRRIVAKIEELAGKIEEARGLREDSRQQGPVVLASTAASVFQQIMSICGPTQLGAFSPHVTSGPRNWGKVYAESGYRFYRAQDIGADGQVLNGSKVYVSAPKGNQGTHARLCDGDLLIVITGATVGRCSVYSAALEPGFVSQHVAICRLPRDRVEPRYALWGLRGPSGQQQLLGQRYGQGKPGLNLGNIRSLELPFPPLSEQRHVVGYLDDLQANVDSLRALQAHSAAELDALLPSILDKAFKGELG